MDSEFLANSILKNLENTDSNYANWDSLSATDNDYMMFSPKPVGYNTIAEQQYLMQNLLVGFNGGSLLDVGCGRCDLYGVAKQLTDMYNSNITYSGIDHNPIMTQLGEQKWNLQNIQIGAFETSKLTKHDWVVASGLFTQRRCETETEELTKVINDIDILYNLANHVVAFNLLSPINTIHRDGFFYVHPGLIMDMMIEKYQHVTIRANYSNDVYTVLIYKI